MKYFIFGYFAGLIVALSYRLQVGLGNYLYTKFPDRNKNKWYQNLLRTVWWSEDELNEKYEK